MSRTQKCINGFSGKGSRGQRLRRHILHLCRRVLDEQMMGKRPATVSAERGQSPVNGSRGSPIIALASHAPVPQVLIPEQHWIEAALPCTFPPGDKMGKVLSDDYHSGGETASPRVGREGSLDTLITVL